MGTWKKPRMCGATSAAAAAPIAAPSTRTLRRDLASTGGIVRALLLRRLRHQPQPDHERRGAGGHPAAVVAGVADRFPARLVEALVDARQPAAHRLRVE